MKLSIVLLTAVAFIKSNGDESYELGANFCGDTPDSFLRLFRGVDITQLHLHPSDSTEPDGVKGFTMHYTCVNSSNTWLNPFTESTVQIPDQVDEVDGRHGSLLDVSTAVLADEDDVKKWFSHQVGLEYHRGMFGNSPTMMRVIKEMISRAIVFTEVSSSTSRIILSLESMQLSTQATACLSQLPDEFYRDPDSYQEFIEKFGTHVFESAVFGPLIKNQFSVNLDQYKSFEKGFLEAQSAGLHKSWLQTQTEINPQNFEADQGFSKKTTMQSFLFGGDPALVFLSGLDGWLKSAVQTPMIAEGRLVPIYDLIDDIEWKRSMEKAVVAHLDRAYLRELILKLETSIGLYKINSRLDNLLNRAQEELAVKIPNHDVVERLGEDVEFELDIPLWWRKTEFCMQYRNDEGQNFCKGRSPNCARVDQSTRAFTDATRNKGGCYLSWGVFGTPTQNDTWFNEVQLCMKYVPVGDPNQCDRWGIPERCSGLNEYTEDYYDKTDGRAGGCALAWKLYIPDEDELPTWFLNSKLCHNVLSQTMGKILPEFEKSCARINEYTPYYMDYTANPRIQVWTRMPGFQPNLIQWSLENGIKDYWL